MRSSCSTLIAEDFWKALVQIYKCLARFCLLVSSSVCASRCMIRFCSDMKASADTGVTGVCGSASSRQGPITSSALGTAGSATGAGILLSTLSGLNGNKLLAAKPALIFFGVNALFFAGLYRDVKCFLPIVFTPSCSSRSTWLR